MNGILASEQPVRGEIADISRPGLTHQMQLPLKFAGVTVKTAHGHALVDLYVTALSRM